MPASACMWGQCGRPAKYQIGFRVWSYATPVQRSKHNCADMLSSVTVCEECSKRVKVQDFLLPEGRARISAGFNALGKALPDLTAAQLKLNEIVGGPVDVVAVFESAKRRGDRTEEA